MFSSVSAGDAIDADIFFKKRRWLDNGIMVSVFWKNYIKGHKQLLVPSFDMIISAYKVFRVTLFYTS